jgi:predicted extracellular nuclease
MNLNFYRRPKTVDTQVSTVAFYNLENFFDTKDDPHALDDDFTPDGKKAWTPKRFRYKVKKLSKTIRRIGDDVSTQPPVLVGLAEVENRGVIERLLETKFLNQVNYGIAHFDSPDERGIDTALLYNRDVFQLLHQERVPVYLTDEYGDRDYTRDILYVNGMWGDDLIHLFVNHWPSRRAGVEETEEKRLHAAETVLRQINALEQKESDPYIVVMGDFNDGPESPSIRLLDESISLINPFQQVKKSGQGSAFFKGKWSLFDQILLSPAFFQGQSEGPAFRDASVYSPRFLTQYKGRFKGSPFRTYGGPKYRGGYSDHFPVYVALKRKKSRL